MATPLEDDMSDERRQRAMNFLDDDIEGQRYTEEIKSMLHGEEQRLTININDVRSTNSELAAEILQHPFEMTNAFTEALNEIIKRIEGPQHNETYYIGFRGSFGDNNVTPRSVSATMLGKMLCIEGIISRASLVRPKVVKSVHYCAETNKHVRREYRDQTSMEKGGPTGSVYPSVDDDGNPLVTEFGLSTYRDNQVLFIQEMPERAPAGQLPRSIQAIVENDLVDKVKPGDRVRIVGAYKTLSNKAGGTTSGIFKSVLITNNIILLNKEIQAPNITADDIKNIRKVSKKKGKRIFNSLANSLAPSIHGMDYIKRAMLCVLLGGVEKNLENGTHLRGDINVMMVGDPSTAKSQVLRFVLRTAPLAIATTGRGSSGVGLTAAVTMDPDTGERRLEAGAMVLADRGVVCIDEFDKMSDADRVAIHEVMEQQTVTVAKGGIHASLNARCSVVAAANPVFGQYDSTRKPNENIQLPDSLLSRFDLLFIVLDTADPVKDKILCEHVLRMHQYRAPNQQDGEVIEMNDTMEVEEEMTTGAENEDGTSEIYSKSKLVVKGRSEKQKLLSTAFVKKYIHYAKNTVTPVLTQAACDILSQEYSELRQVTEDLKTLPITARCFETLIRLSTAHAKARLSKTIEEEDCIEALRLLNYALYQNAKRVEYESRKADDSDEEDDDEKKGSQATSTRAPKRTAVRRKTQDDDAQDKNDEDGDVMDEDDEQELATKRKRRRLEDDGGEVVESSPKSLSRSSRMMKKSEGAHDLSITGQDTEMEVEEEEEVGKDPEAVEDVPPEEVADKEHQKNFRLRLLKLFDDSRLTALPASQIYEAMEDSFTKGQVAYMLKMMSHDNHVMLAANVVYRV